MLEDQFYLKAPDARKPFCGAMFHDFLTGMGLANAAVPASKLAFVMFKLEEFLGGKTIDEGSGPNRLTAQELERYKQLLVQLTAAAGKYVCEHPGKEDCPAFTTLLNILAPVSFVLRMC